ncbi:MAG: cobyric acid synthase CobQ, partial [Oscillospiraceae bacterium]|nr:cobyric acid synthase CobQ [Oscillospiraceae bacterium]
DTELDLDDEDSLSERLSKHTIRQNAVLDIAVIKFPRISNFTDFKILESLENISVRYVSGLQELQNPDLIILPGTKNTISDLLWMRQNGLEAGILKAHEKGAVMFGICGGYQMLGRNLSDPEQIEQGGEVRGMGLCNIDTIFRKQKRTTQIAGKICHLDADFQNLAGIAVTGYEIHTGETYGQEQPFLQLETGDSDGCFCSSENSEIFGTYLHGIFDNQEFTEKFLNCLISRKKQKNNQIQNIKILNPALQKEEAYDKLADLLRKHLDLSKIYQILESGN